MKKLSKSVCLSVLLGLTLMAQPAHAGLWNYVKNLSTKQKLVGGTVLVLGTLGLLYAAKKGFGFNKNFNNQTEPLFNQKDINNVTDFINNKENKNSEDEESKENVTVHTLFVSKNKNNKPQVLLHYNGGTFEAFKRKSIRSDLLGQVDLLYVVSYIGKLFSDELTKEQRESVKNPDTYFMTEQISNYAPTLKKDINKANRIKVFMIKNDKDPNFLCNTELSQTDAYGDEEDSVTYGAGWVKWENIQKIKDCNDTKPLTDGLYIASDTIDPVILQYLQSDKDFVDLMKKN